MECVELSLGESWGSINKHCYLFPVEFAERGENVLSFVALLTSIK